MMASTLPLASPLPGQLPWRRMRGKQRLQVVQSGLPDCGSEGTASTRKQVYLITFPHPRITRTQDGFEVVAPESLDRGAILSKLLDSCARPIYTDTCAGTDTRCVDALRTGIFFELHKEDEAGQVHRHAHAPLLASRFYFIPVKRALLQRHGLVSHWSCSHEGYWSAVRYVFVPSPKLSLIHI